MVSDRNLDRSQRTCSRSRFPHRTLRIEEIVYRTGVGTRVQHACPPACCSAMPGTLIHIFLICPVAAAVMAGVCATLGAIDGGGISTQQCKHVPGGRPWGAQQDPARVVAWRCLPACLRRTGRQNRQQRSRQPGLWQRAFWGMCGTGVDGTSSARPPARLLQCSASHAHSRLCNMPSGSWGFFMGVCRTGALTEEKGPPHT